MSQRPIARQRTQKDPEAEKVSPKDHYLSHPIDADDISYTVVGATQFYLDRPRADLSAAKQIKLSRLYVDYDFHGSGVAQALLAEVERAALHTGADLIWLTTWEKAFRAQRFYLKSGFRIVGKDFFQVGDVAQTDVVMTKSFIKSGALSDQQPRTYIASLN